LSSVIGCQPGSACSINLTPSPNKGHNTQMAWNNAPSFPPATPAPVLAQQPSPASNCPARSPTFPLQLSTPQLVSQHSLSSVQLPPGAPHSLSCAQLPQLVAPHSLSRGQLPRPVALPLVSFLRLFESNKGTPYRGRLARLTFSLQRSTAPRRCLLKFPTRSPTFPLQRPTAPPHSPPPDFVFEAV
jgi:hypothetical protein